MVGQANTTKTISKKASSWLEVLVLFKVFFYTGIYVCSKCGKELFDSSKKFEHTSAWPAFTETISKDSVIKEIESNYAFRVFCVSCRRRLGHEFINDGPRVGESRY